MKIHIVCLLTSAFCLHWFSSASQSVAINTDGSAANASAILDIKSSTAGVLVPRMNSSQRTAITTPAQGLLVYDTDTNSFWFYNGTSWNNLSVSLSGGWQLTGNAGTNPSTHFLGTTDNQPLRWRVNNLWAGEIHQLSRNVFMGLGAGEITTSGDNTAIGNYAFSKNIGGGNNTAIGSGAIYSNTTGSFNTAVGADALYYNNQGSNNTAFGSASLSYNKASNNAAFGAYSLYSNITGSGNTAMGESALTNNSNGYGNTAVGKSALYTNITGIHNTAIGDSSLFNNVASSNTAVGYASLYSNTSGFENTALGQGALYANTGGTNNTGIGFAALAFNSFGTSNTALGNYTLYNNIQGASNVAVGAYGLYNNTGNFNTAIGYDALGSNGSGTHNTGVGYLTLSANTTGAGNTAIGFAAGPNTANLSNTTCIGNGASATANNQLVLGNANVTQFYCYGGYVATSAFAPNMTILNTGQIVRSTSSRRYKKNIVDLEINTYAIYKLRPVSYTSLNKDTKHFGLIAEEVAELIPQLAEYAKEKDVIKGSASEKLVPDAVQYSLLSVLLLKEVQKHEKIIDDQNKKIESLMKELQHIKGKLK